jgi:membrane protein implicated in regulation of membrane protease activity
MIEIPIGDWVFVVAAVVGGVLLLLTVVLDDFLGGIFDALHLDIGGTSITPILLAFVAMFGAGGLFGTQVLDLHEGQAAVVGIGFGLVGAVFAGLLFGFLRRSESPEPFKIEDLVGDQAHVAVAIPAGRYGSVIVRAEGQTHEFSATADADIPAGRTVRIVAVAGTGVVVRLEEAVTAPEARSIEREA